jgi:hypothetical protein
LENSFEKGSRKLLFLLPLDCEVDDGTSGVKGFNDLILVVTGEDESAVVIKCLNIRP